MRRTLVLNVVGLTPKLVGEHTPHLAALARQGALRPLATIEPAVTCAVQATMTTGTLPREHGVVANGWYYRDLAEIALWRQSNALVTGEMIWDAAKKRDAAFTCAKLFWWFNMYATADFAVTPRPQYPADGRKIPDVHTHPAELRDELQAELGTFPLFKFWGPAADITCSAWIAKCAARVWDRCKPTLSLVYLPHLDYDLQRLGPDDPRIATALRGVDALCGALIEQATRDGAAVIVLSEYGITSVSGAVPLNQVLRRAGLLAVRREDAGELLDAGASEAFAVCDHQLAHVYVRRPERIEEVAALVRAQAGVE
ncbi:MAG: type phosphodiesterase/nucleotide pyrophosphatase, partial [Myxococcales bacterium]|nr:type phosphodiesterase/nucleotide pyrophosphatase [Myxococcales bacterium]